MRRRRLRHVLCYVVETWDFTPQGPVQVNTSHRMGLEAAHRRAANMARRGLALFGGDLTVSLWGARGGQFPTCYRSAHIRVARNLSVKGICQGLDTCS